MSPVIERIVPGVPAFYDTSVVAGTPAGCSWVGASPYIDTADAGASYGQVEAPPASFSGGYGVGLSFPPWSGSGITGARVDFQAHFSNFAGTPVAWNLNDADDSFYWSVVDYEGMEVLVDGAGWYTFSDTIPLSSPGADLPSLLAALATGTMTLGVYQTTTGSNVLQVSQLSLTLIGSDAPNLAGQLLDDRVRFWGS